MNCFNDNPTTEIDVLGYATFATELRQILLDVDPPFSVTLGGRWGAGKTSMLKFLMKSLDQSDFKPWNFTTPNNVCPIWFNPWQYQGESNPMLPLLHEIRSQLGIWKKLTTTMESGSEQMVDIGIKALGACLDTAVNFLVGRKVSTIGQTVVSEAEKIAERHRQNVFAEPLMAQKFQEEFENAIITVIGGGKSNQGRLVIFIDDLDRCADTTVFALLESIKLFLSSKACVFVFALDRVHVETAVAQAGHYNSAEAADYVDKLFQARLHLPQPEKEKLNAFVANLLKDGKLGEYFSHEQILPLLPHNPRIIKNFLNSLIALKPSLKLDSDADKNQRKLLDHWLRCFAPDVYELLDNEEEVIRPLLAEYCHAPNTANSLNAFFHSSLSSPLLTQEIKMQEGRLQEKDYRLLRTRVWREGAIKTFREQFARTFRVRPNVTLQPRTNIHE